MSGKVLQTPSKSFYSTLSSLLQTRVVLNTEIRLYIECLSASGELGVLQKGFTRAAVDTLTSSMWSSYLDLFTERAPVNTEWNPLMDCPRGAVIYHATKEQLAIYDAEKEAIALRDKHYVLCPCEDMAALHLHSLIGSGIDSYKVTGVYYQQIFNRERLFPDYEEAFKFVRTLYPDNTHTEIRQYVPEGYRHLRKRSDDVQGKDIDKCEIYHRLYPRTDAVKVAEIEKCIYSYDPRHRRHEENGEYILRLADFRTNKIR